MARESSWYKNVLRKKGGKDDLVERKDSSSILLFLPFARLASFKNSLFSGRDSRSFQSNLSCHESYNRNGFAIINQILMSNQITDEVKSANENKVDELHDERECKKMRAPPSPDKTGEKSAIPHPPHLTHDHSHNDVDNRHENRHQHKKQLNQQPPKFKWTRNHALKPRKGLRGRQRVRQTLAERVLIILILILVHPLTRNAVTPDDDRCGCSFNHLT